MSHEDPDVRQLLEESDSDVEPTGGLDAIRARTTHSRQRHPRRWGVAAATVATAAVITAVVALTGLPGTHPSTPGPASRGTGTALAPVYFLGDTGVGPRLFREDRPGPSGNEATVHALQLAVAGAALDPEYRSAWPTGTRVAAVSTQTNSLVVHLDGKRLRLRPEGVSAAQARISVQQLVYTARGSRTDSPLYVRFEVGGSPVGSLLGVHAGSVAPGPPDSTFAPISIGSPASPSDAVVTVDSPVTVTGQAATSEGNVQWELQKGDTVVRHGFTTARACCTLSPYSFRVRVAPGDYTLVVHDEDASGAGATSSDSKRLHVR